ncbi:MAG: TraR/DksA C4-type zinc finger protein [bacterium]|nr:TraR/DksA C4-type zinc finger protein [bacterium]
MEIREQEKFRPVLEEMRREIDDRQKRAGTVISQNVFATDPVLDEADKAEANSRLAVSVVLCEHASSTLRSIRLALSRIDRGVFGDCLGCEEAIPLLRLQVMPYSSLCLPCQDEAERHQTNPPEILFGEEKAPHEELTSEERMEEKRRKRIPPPTERTVE